MSNPPFPLGSSVNLDDLDKNLHDVSRRLRETEPISKLAALDAWFISSYELATLVMRDAKTFTVDHPGFSTARVVGESMLSLDGEKHQQHRQPFEKPFRKKELDDRFSNTLKQDIDSLLNRLAPQGKAELRRDYAGPIAVKTMITALGLEDLDLSTVLSWYDDIVDAVTRVTAGNEVSEASQTALRALQKSLIPSLKGTKQSLLAAASGAATNLSDEQIITNAVILLFGGIETTEGMISNAFYHLLSNQNALEEATENPSLLANVIEESLRLEPAASVVDRYATKDVTLANAVIKQGDLVRVSLAGANRDPSIFAYPDSFNPNRHNLRSHVTFAQGPHVCLGLHLARLETQLALELALKQLPNLVLDDAASAQKLATPQGLVFRKPEALYATWRA